MRRRMQDTPDPEVEIPSKTQIKQAMHSLQDLGAALMELPEAKLKRIEMDENLRDALDELRRLTSHSARKRQVQYVGKLLRSVDVTPLRRALDDQRQGHARTVRALQDMERWRDRLLANDKGLADWIVAHPTCDTPEFRALLAKARAEYDEFRSAGQAPGAAATKGKYYRELFQRIRALLQAPAEKTTEEI